jgi:hypothetical protein
LNVVPRIAENLPQQLGVGFAILNLQKMQRFTHDDPFITVFTITPRNCLTFRIKDAVMVLAVKVPRGGKISHLIRRVSCPG